MKKTRHVALVVALQAEAHFLLDHFQFQIICEKPFQYYRNRTGDRHLVVSGAGPIHSAAATAYLMSHLNPEWTLFINIGLAGARDLSVGEFYEINMITDSDSGKSYYPKFESKQSKMLFTAASPCEQYSEEGLHDMEGAAFFVAANCFTSHENIRIFKIISDNSLLPPEGMTKEGVATLFKDNRLQLDALFHRADDYLATVEVDRAFGLFTQQLHFSAYQKHELSEYLRRFKIHHPDLKPEAFLPGSKTAQDVLNKFRRFLLVETECGW